MLRGGPEVGRRRNTTLAGLRAQFPALLLELFPLLGGSVQLRPLRLLIRYGQSDDGLGVYRCPFPLEKVGGDDHAALGVGVGVGAGVYALVHVLELVPPDQADQRCHRDRGVAEAVVTDALLQDIFHAEVTQRIAGDVVRLMDIAPCVAEQDRQLLARVPPALSLPR